VKEDFLGKNLVDMKKLADLVLFGFMRLFSIFSDNS